MDGLAICYNLLDFDHVQVIKDDLKSSLFVVVDMRLAEAYLLPLIV